MAGTSAKRKFIPIHTIALSMEDQIRKNILAFHAITGCCPFRMLQSVIIVMVTVFIGAVANVYTVYAKIR